ncbi:THAP-type domain-containing protein, partial [Aphis craccivora]
FSIFENMQCVNNESNLLFDQTIQFDTHRDELITTICKTYYKVRFFHEVRKFIRVHSFQITTVTFKFLKNGKNMCHGKEKKSPHFTYNFNWTL